MSLLPKRLLFLLLIGLFSSDLISQTSDHHFEHPWRLSMLIGHSVVPEADGGGLFFVPTWAFDIDYHLNTHWSIGIHSDLELENYKIRSQNDEIITINTPLVSSVDFFYRFHPNLVFGLGPGLTYENKVLKVLIRSGVEAEVPINRHWEGVATLYFDQRFDGHKVWTLAVGAAYYL